MKFTTPTRSYGDQYDAPDTVSASIAPLRASFATIRATPRHVSSLILLPIAFASEGADPPNAERTMDRCREETRSPPSPRRLRVDGAELKGVRGGVERRRGLAGVKARGDGRRETRAGRESPY